MRFTLLVDGPWDPRRLDEAAGRLAVDLRRIDGVVAAPLTGPAPGDGKSEAVHEIGGLVVSGLLSAAGLTAIADVVVAYLARSGARKITVRDGDREVTVTGASAADVAEVVRDLQDLLRPADGDRKSLE
jgi:membrane-associated two-gene conflict system component 1 (EACC1)